MVLARENETIRTSKEEIIEDLARQIYSGVDEDRRWPDVDQDDRELFISIASRVFAYTVDTVASVKLTTKLKPWKETQQKKGEPNASQYRKGYYDGWAGLQSVLRFEFGG
jgi:hypothetical protein